MDGGPWTRNVECGREAIELDQRREMGLKQKTAKGRLNFDEADQLLPVATKKSSDQREVDEVPCIFDFDLGPLLLLFSTLTKSESEEIIRQGSDDQQNSNLMKTT